MGFIGLCIKRLLEVGGGSGKVDPHSRRYLLRKP